jgi:mono/diheme cytochrome c family protein
MKRILKGLGIGLVAVVLMFILITVGLYLYTDYQLTRIYIIPVEPVKVPIDASTISRGQHLAMVHCAVCHGDNLAGGVVFEDPSLGRIAAPNLTRGRGGLGGQLTDADYVRAIRHGIGPDGRALVIMPSRSFYYFSDDDLGALIAYAKSAPAVDHNTSDLVVTTPLARVLMAAGAFGDIFPAMGINHTGPRPVAPVPGVTAAYGDYLVVVGECRSCHGDNLAGGKDPNPKAPPAPNLTRGGELRAWSEADFIRTLRMGTTPAGYQLSDFMPWKYFGQMTDDELRAVWMYLQTLQPTPR